MTAVFPCFEKLESHKFSYIHQFSWHGTNNKRLRTTNPFLMCYSWHAAQPHINSSPAIHWNISICILNYSRRTSVFASVSVSMCASKKKSQIWLNVNLWFANIYFFLSFLQVSQRLWAKGKTGKFIVVVCYVYIAACANKRTNYWTAVVVRVFNSGNAVSHFMQQKFSTFHGNHT